MNATRIKLLAVFTVLAGCGGGGDDPSSAPSANLVTITSANAPAVAAAVVDSAFEAEGLAAVGGLGSVGVPTASAPPEPVALRLLGEITSERTEALKQQAMLGLLQASIPEQMLPCDVNGQMILSGEVANAGTFTAGDTFTFTFMDCEQSDGVTINGAFSMSVTAFSGDLQSGAIMLELSVMVTGFEISDGTSVATMNGRVDIALDFRSPTVILVSVSTTGLTVADGTATRTLIEFSVVQRFDASQSIAYSLDVSGSLTSSEFTGRIDFETTALLQSDGTDYAFSGQLVIHGANGASITVFVVSNQTVELRIDLNGDGNVDETVTTTWAELT